MKKKIQIVPAVLIMLSVLGMSAYASGEKETSVTSRFRTGEVRIAIRQETVEEARNLVPGKPVSMPTDIEVQGDSCYVRVRLLTDAKEKIPLTCFGGIPDGWIEKGKYLYYEKPISHGESVKVYKTFALPQSWDQDKIDKENIQIQTEADAVQSRNFEPDFTSDTPWGDTEILEANEPEEGYIFRLMDSDAGLCKVILEGDRIVANPDTFFEDFGDLAPGDVFQGEIQIKNNFPVTETLWMKVAAELESELIQEMHLTITEKSGETVYDDNLDPDSLSKFQFLREYGPGEEDTLSFSLSIPENLDNAYARKNGSMTWTFLGQSAMADPPEQGNSGGDIMPDQKEPVKTGERSISGLFLIFAAAGCTIFGCAYGWIRRKRKEKRRHV